MLSQLDVLQRRFLGRPLGLGLGQLRDRTVCGGDFLASLLQAASSARLLRSRPSSQLTFFAGFFAMS
jgi:hypothetical protein